MKLGMQKWEECGRIPVDLEALAGKPCIVGLDLANINDLAALAAVFKVDDQWHVIMKYWCPEESIRERGLKDRVPYETWAKQGYLTPTPGGRIDYARIRADINAMYSAYDIREIAVDPWNAHQLSTELEEGDGFTVVHVRQGFYSLNAPTKEFISCVAERKIAHGNHPVLTWNAGNMATEEDASGNLKPSKKKSHEKIDGCVAVITALSRCLVAQTNESVYHDRGVISW